MKEARAQLGTEATEGSCMSTWYSSSSITFAFQVSGILGNLSPAVCSHPRSPKHRQTRISVEIRAWRCFGISSFTNFRGNSSLAMFSHPNLPKRCQATGRDRISSKFLKSWHLWGRRCYSCSDFWNFCESRSLSMFSHPRLPASHDPAGSGGS